MPCGDGPRSQARQDSSMTETGIMCRATDANNHDMTQQEWPIASVSRDVRFSPSRGGRYNPAVGPASRLAEAFDAPVEALFELDQEEGHD